ncbi:hypothetical protein KAX02_12580 [candidate division WOR-3 bacterium]|nr:hypothetical protein [candidate division WOR-3 bacterium]
MFKKAILVVISMVFITTVAFAGAPDLTWHGTWYTYSFFWNNANFIKAEDDTPEDGDQFYYMHGDVSLNADFGAGVSTYLTLGAWGTYGKHAITCEGPEGPVALREAYLNIANLFDSPLSFTIGKQHVLYGYQVFDGGEDGFMGVKLSYGSEMFDFDIFSYRLVEGGGTDWVGFWTPIIQDDWDLHGIWATAKLMDGNFKLSPYAFMRTISTTYCKTEEGYKDNPMWIGLFADGSPMAGLKFAGEFAMMMGSETWETGKNDEESVDYKGMHYMAQLGYTPPGMPVTVGGAYVALSGDDPETEDENELYESPTWGPYTFGFYKWWPGFGPAHLMNTLYGFSLLAPWEPFVSNLNIINANIGFANGPLALRADYFMYSFNKVDEDVESALGNEIALLLTYNYNETVTLGGTIGYLMPGAYIEDLYGVKNGDDVEVGNMLGGYLFACIGF